MGVESATFFSSSSPVAAGARFLPCPWTAGANGNAQVIGGGEDPVWTFHAKCGTGLAYSFIEMTPPRWGGR